AAVSEVDAAVQMQRTWRERRAVGVRLAMARRARPRKVPGRRRSVTVATGHLAAVVPRRLLARAAAVVARDGASLRGPIVARLGPHDGVAEDHLDRAVAVHAADDFGRRRRVTGGAGERLAADRRTLDVSRVSARLRAIGRKKARISRRIRAFVLSVA